MSPCLLALTLPIFLALDVAGATQGRRSNDVNWDDVITLTQLAKDCYLKLEPEVRSQCSIELALAVCIAQDHDTVRMAIAGVDPNLRHPTISTMAETEVRLNRDLKWIRPLCEPDGIDFEMLEIAAYSKAGRVEAANDKVSKLAKQLNRDDAYGVIARGLARHGKAQECEAMIAKIANPDFKLEVAESVAFGLRQYEASLSLRGLELWPTGTCLHFMFLTDFASGRKPIPLVVRTKSELVQQLARSDSDDTRLRLWLGYLSELLLTKQQALCASEALAGFEWAKSIEQPSLRARAMIVFSHIAAISGDVSISKSVITDIGFKREARASDQALLLGTCILSNEMDLAVEAVNDPLIEHFLLREAFGAFGIRTLDFKEF